MPYAIKTKDGITVQDIPDDVAADDPRLKALVAQLRAAGQKSASFGGAPAPAQAPGAAAGQEPGIPPAPAGAPAATMPEDWQPRVGALERMMGIGSPSPQTDPLGMLGATVRGAGPVAMGAGVGALFGAPIAGVGAIPGAAAGAGAMALTQFVGDPLVEVINGMFGTNLTKPTDALMQLFTALGVPEPDTAAERVIQAAAAGGTGAAGSIALGQALQRGAQQLAPEAVTMLQRAIATGVPQHGKDAIKGAGTMKAVGDALAAGAGSQILGGMTSGAASQAAAEAGASPLVQIGAGLAGGMAGSALGGLASPPTKTGKVPMAEADEAGIRVLSSDVRPPKTAGGKWLQRRMEELPLGTGGLRSKQASERVKAVKSLLHDFGADDVANIADDLTADLAATRSATLKKWTGAKLEVIDKLSGAPVPMTKTMAQIDDALAQLQGLGTPEVQPVIEKLSAWKTAFNGKSLDQVEDLRAIVRNAKADPGLAVVKTKGTKLIDDIYKAVRSDMGDYITAAGEPGDIAKWRDADKALAGMVEELKIPAMKAALNRGEITPEHVNRLLFSSDRSTVAKLYQNLSPEGRASARAAILAKAAGEAAEDVSPDKFAAAVKKMGNQVGVFFEDGDLKQVQGLVRVLEFTKHAAAATASPHTGMQLVLPAGMAVVGNGLSGVFGQGLNGMILTGGAVAGATATLGATARLLESKPVRNMLINIATLKPDSPEELAAMKELLKRVTAQRAISLGQVSQQSPAAPEKTKTPERTGTLYAK